MSSDTLQTLLIIVTLLVAGFATYRSFQTTGHVDLTPSTLVATVKEAVPVAKELMDVSTIAVQAAEQLKNTGKLPDNSAAFAYALNYVKRWFPGGSEISNEDIVGAIESAVLVVNTLSEKISSRE